MAHGSLRLRSVLIRSNIRPLTASHFRTALSGHPATSHVSIHCPSCSSSVSESNAWARSIFRSGTSGPQAMLSILALMESNFRSTKNWKRPMGQSNRPAVLSARHFGEHSMRYQARTSQSAQRASPVVLHPWPSTVHEGLTHSPKPETPTQARLYAEYKYIM